MKPRRNVKSEENRAAAASLLADLDEEFAVSAGSASPDLNLGEKASNLTPSVELETNRRQTRDKAETQLETNWRQTEDKLETDLLETRDNRAEMGSKLETQPRTRLETNWRQTEDKLETKIVFSSLVGLQRRVIIFLYQSVKAARSSTTEPVTIEHLAQSCETSVSSAKKTLQRLEKRNFFRRAEFRDGRGGWTKYELLKEVFQDLLRAETEDKLETKWRQTRDKVETQPETQPRTSSSSSSRYLNIKESTTTELDGLISTIDLTSVRHLGITTSVMARCIELYPALKPEQLEILVFRFAEFAKDTKNKVQNARGFFISLAEQASKGQVPLDHIETSDERLMRLFIERQKEKKSRRVSVEQAAQEFECEAWLETLTVEMKLALIPETSLLKAGTGAHTAMLKSYFADHLWPERRKQILEREAPL